MIANFRAVAVTAAILPFLYAILLKKGASSWFFWLPIELVDWRKAWEIIFLPEGVWLLIRRWQYGKDMGKVCGEYRNGYIKNGQKITRQSIWGKKGNTFAL